jgi:ribonuclease HI
VKGFPKAVFKSFKSEKEALAFVASVQNEETAAFSKKRSSPLPTTDSGPIKRRKKQFDNIIKANIMFDGGSRGNPGVSGSGATLTISEVSFVQGKEMQNNRAIHLRKYLGDNFTNNEAEYFGIISGLQFLNKEASMLCPPPSSLQTTLIVQGDSDLVVKQLNGTYQCRNIRLQKLYKNVINLIEDLKLHGDCNISFEHVYRQDNSLADGKVQISNLNFCYYKALH